MAMERTSCGRGMPSTLILNCESRFYSSIDRPIDLFELLHLENVIGHVAVRLAMDLKRRFSGRRFREAEHFARDRIIEVLDVPHAVLILDRQISGVRFGKLLHSGAVHSAMHI